MDGAEKAADSKKRISHTAISQEPVTTRELRAWYSFGVAMEGYAALAIASYFPILLEGLSASVAVVTDNISTPCDASVIGYDCSVNVCGTYIRTTSLVFYGTTVSVLCQFFVFTALGSLADHGYNLFFLT